IRGRNAAAGRRRRPDRGWRPGQAAVANPPPAAGCRRTTAPGAGWRHRRSRHWRGGLPGKGRSLMPAMRTHTRTPTGCPALAARQSSARPARRPGDGEPGMSPSSVFLAQALFNLRGDLGWNVQVRAHAQFAQHVHDAADADAVLAALDVHQGDVAGIDHGGEIVLADALRAADGPDYTAQVLRTVDGDVHQMLPTNLNRNLE